MVGLDEIGLESHKNKLQWILSKHMRELEMVLLKVANQARPAQRGADVLVWGFWPW